MPLAQRPRRNRQNEAIRSLVRETRLHPGSLVAPLFVKEGSGKTEVASMPGVWRHSIDSLVKEARALAALGVPAVAIFAVVPAKLKDKKATVSTDPRGLYPRAIRALKSKVPGMLVITDVAMDPYSSDGHDGLVSDNGKILNDATLPILAAQALVQAEAGADIVAPSDMMDGRIAHIRAALDRAGFEDTGILAYTAKYASAFYGPFRDALSSAPRKGDKKTYQMDPANVREAVRETRLDIKEGADMVMVKPGLPYLDVVRAVREASTVPVAAYNVSGEYAMLRAAAAKGWLPYKETVLESLTALKRAGADVVLTYHAREAAEWLA